MTKMNTSFADTNSQNDIHSVSCEMSTLIGVASLASIFRNRQEDLSYRISILSRRFTCNFFEDLIECAFGIKS
jgi:hypothetical protein